jgi:hypothetical protein
MKNDPSASACVTACRHSATSSGFSTARLCYRGNALITAPGPRNRREPARQSGRDTRFPGSANRQRYRAPYGPVRSPVVGAGAQGVSREEVPVQAEPPNMSRCSDLVNCHRNRRRRRSPIAAAKIRAGLVPIAEGEDRENVPPPMTLLIRLRTDSERCRRLIWVDCACARHLQQYSQRNSCGDRNRR